VLDAEYAFSDLPSLEKCSGRELIFPNLVEYLSNAKERKCSVRIDEAKLATFNMLATVEEVGECVVILPCTAA